MSQDVKYISYPIWKVDKNSEKNSYINELDTEICHLIPNTILFVFENRLQFIYVLIKLVKYD
jgi:hypothetical protein